MSIFREDNFSSAWCTGTRRRKRRFQVCWVFEKWGFRFLATLRFPFFPSFFSSSCRFILQVFRLPISDFHFFSLSSLSLSVVLSPLSLDLPGHVSPALLPAPT